MRDNEAVQRGQFLFEIDPTDYELALAAARANRDKARANAEIARKTFERRQRLVRGKVISSEEFDTAEASWHAAQATAEAAEAGVHQAGQNLAYCRVLAPVNGYATGITFDVGTYVQAGQALFSVVDRESFWVSAIFKETALPALLPGRKVHLWFAPLPGRTFEGTVESTGWAVSSADFATQSGLPDIAPTVDWVRLTRRFPVHIRLGADAAALPLKIGATASVKVLAVPRGGYRSREQRSCRPIKGQRRTYPKGGGRIFGAGAEGGVCCHAGFSSMNVTVSPTAPRDRVQAAPADAEVELAQARERERAWQDRAEQLERANEALRRGVAGVTRLEDLGGFLGEMLQAAAGLAGAHGGAVVLLDAAEQNYHFAALLTREGIVPPEKLVGRSVPLTPALRCWVEGMAGSPAGWPLAPDDPLHEPETRAFHAAQGNRALRHVPMRAGDRLIGWLGLGFAEVEPELGDSHLLLQALADQMALAVETLRLAEEARHAAVAREREQAAEQRAAELAKVNDTLRRGLDRVADPGRFDDYVAALLRESAEVFQADAAAVFLREGEGTTMRPAAVVDGGRLLSQPEIIGDFFLGTFAEVTARDPGGIMSGICSSGHHQVDIDDNLGRVWPQAQAWHQARGHRISWQFPLRARGETRGFFAFALRRTDPLSATQVESVAALAQQFTLALELIRLGEEAKRAAIAREREQAAQERAEQLAKANAALSRSLDGLVGHGQLETFLDSVLREAITPSGAVSGAVFVHETADDTLRLAAMILRGETLVATCDPRAAAFIRPVPAATGLVWPVVSKQHEVFWLDYSKPDPRDWPQSHAWHRAHGHRFVACIPMLLAGETVGFLGLAFDQNEVVRPTETRLELCRVLAQQATLALHLTRLAESARESAVAREREAAAHERAAELARTNAAVGDSLNELVELTDLRAFLRHVFGQCARLSGALGGGLFFHDEATDTLRKQLGWIKGEVVDFTDEAGAAFWQEPVPAATIPDWAEPVQIAANSERIWKNARPWHKAQGYGWLSRVPLKAGAHAFGFLGMAFARREDLTAEKAELTCAMAHQIALAVQLDRLARTSEQAAVTREQEKAAREQASELAKANGVLRRGVEQLSSPHRIRDILDRFLFEAAGIAGAAAGGVFQRVGEGTEFVMRSLTQDGAVVSDFESFNAEEGYRRATGADLDGYMRRTVNGESFYFPTASLARWFPEVAEYHRVHGHRTIGHFPFGVGGEITGYLALAFREDGPPGTVPTETVRTLALQASLALETQRLADEAKEAAVLAERNRIARDLHDVLAQGFVGVLTQLGVLEGALEMDEPQEVARVAARVRDIARDGLEEARRSVRALRPDGQGGRLFERLRAILAGLTAGTTLDAAATETGQAAALSEQADWAAVKFVQQSLTNTLHYADARTFRLALAWDAAGLTLTARDDGAGFDADAPRAGIGLRAMAERAAECGGRFHVESAPGAGTALRLFLPIHSPAPTPPRP